MDLWKEEDEELEGMKAVHTKLSERMRSRLSAISAAGFQRAAPEFVNSIFRPASCGLIGDPPKIMDFGSPFLLHQLLVQD